MTEGIQVASRRAGLLAADMSGARYPFPFEHGHQAHRSEVPVGIPVQIANHAFLDKSGSEVSPMGALVVDEYKEFDAMRRQVLEADLQDRSQQARSDTASGVPNRDAPEPDALVGASDALQNGKAGNVGAIARHQISGGRVVDFSGVLLGIPSTDQLHITFRAFDPHDGRDVGFARGLNLHGGSLALPRLPGNAQGEELQGSRKKGHKGSHKGRLPQGGGRAGRALYSTGARGNRTARRPHGNVMA